MSLTKETVQTLRPKLDELLKDFAEKNGLKAEALGTIHFTKDGLRFAVEMRREDAEDPQVTFYNFLRTLAKGALPELGGEITHNGRKYKTQGAVKGRGCQWILVKRSSDDHPFRIKLHEYAPRNFRPERELVVLGKGDVGTINVQDLLGKP